MRQLETIEAVDANNAPRARALRVRVDPRDGPLDQAAHKAGLNLHAPLISDRSCGAQR